MSFPRTPSLADCVFEALHSQQAAMPLTDESSKMKSFIVDQLGGKVLYGDTDCIMIACDSQENPVRLLSTKKYKTYQSITLDRIPLHHPITCRGVMQGQGIVGPVAFVDGNRVEICCPRQFEDLCDAFAVAGTTEEVQRLITAADLDGLKILNLVDAMRQQQMVEDKVNVTIAGWITSMEHLQSVSWEFAHALKKRGDILYDNPLIITQFDIDGLEHRMNIDGRGKFEVTSVTLYDILSIVLFQGCTITHNYNGTSTTYTRSFV